MEKAKKGNNGKHLPEKQRRIVPFIISYNTVEEACRQARISTVSYYNWLRDCPDFAKAIREARNELVAESMEKLKSNVSKAVDELVSLLESDNAEVKRKSANDIINLSLRWKEMNEIDSRLESIERIILERRIYR